MDPAHPEPVKNIPIGFKPREFIFGLAVAAAIVFSVAGTRWLVRARTTDQASTCRTNLLQLEAAKMRWASDYQRRDTDVPAWTNLVGPKAYVAQNPVCPQGGTYTLGSVTQPPRCSIAGHAAR